MKEFNPTNTRFDLTPHHQYYNRRKSKVSLDEHPKIALSISYNNCLTFPWIKKKVEQGSLEIHQWFFGIKTGTIHTKVGSSFKSLLEQAPMQK